MFEISFNDGIAYVFAMFFLGLIIGYFIAQWRY